MPFDPRGTWAITTIKANGDPAHRRHDGTWREAARTVVAAARHHPEQYPAHAPVVMVDAEHPGHFAQYTVGELQREFAD